jgi:integrase
MALLSSEPGADQVVLLFCLASQISSSGMSASAATVETAWAAFSRTAGGSTVGGAMTVRSYEELRKVDHRAVIAWERIMREIEEAAPSTVRRRLAALSSLCKHLKRHHHVENNPVADVERPAINRREGSTLAFSKADAARLLNTPAEDTLEGLASGGSFGGPAGGTPPRGNRRSFGGGSAPEPRLR